MKIQTAIVLVFVAGLVCSEGAVASSNPVTDAIKSAVQANGYTYVNPPTTAGSVGGVYVKMATTAGQNVPVHICDLFPSAVTTAPTAQDSALEQATESWPNLTEEHDTGFSFFASLTKSLGALTGGSAGIETHNVKSITISWGNIQSTQLQLLDLKQASNTAAGNGTYKGQVNGPCFSETHQLIAQQKDVYLIAKVAIAQSLTAKVALNQPTTGGASNQNGATGSSSQASSGTGTGAGGDTGTRTGTGTNTSGNSTQSGSAGSSSNCTASNEQNGVNACLGVNLFNLLKLNANAGWKQTADDTLTFTKPLNVGFQYLWVNDLVRGGMMTAPQAQMKFKRLTRARLLQGAGSVTKRQVEGIRATLHSE
jgi:hypothetical protein